jgi:hypothetical protein
MGNSFAVDSATTNQGSHGGNTSLSPNADSVQEVRVSTNNFSAEFGRHSSVSVNVVTKQGTDKLHGTLSFFHTDNVLQSRTIYQLPTGPVFRRNEYAWSFGGPIRKDRTFFFGSMDGLRSGVGSGFPTVIESPEFLSYMTANYPNNISTFLMSKYPGSIKPVRNFQTAGNQAGVDCSTLPSPSDPITSALGSIPCNLPITGEGDFAATVPRNGLQWSARIDHLFNNSKDRLYGNVYRTTLDTVLFSSPNVRPAFTEPWLQTSNYFNVNETHTFSPTVINELGLSYVRITGDNKCDPCEIPGISIIGVSGYGQGWGPGVFVQNLYELRDVITLNHGSHSLKAGASHQAIQDYDNFGVLKTRPNYSFLNMFDFALDKPYFESNITIDPLTGAPISSAMAYPSSQSHVFGVFVQDDWKFKSNLTFNIGLRWEDFGNPQQRHGHTTNFIFQGGNDFQSRIADVKLDYTPHLWAHTNYNNFAPRLSFAWDPTKQGKMSVRGGYGIFFNRIPGAVINDIINNPPAVASVTASIYTPPVLPVYGLGTSGKEPFGFPAVTGITPGFDAHNGLLAGKADVRGNDPNTKSQTAYNYFVGVQYAFANNWVVEANYIGSAGRHLVIVYDVNRFAGDLIQNNDVLTRLNHSFGGMTYAQNQTNSIYNGMTVGLKKRFAAGFSIDAAYTLGKTIDSTDIGGGGNDACCSNIADITNLRRERGLAVFDVRQRLALSGLWELPRPKTQSALLNGLLGGWQMSNVTILQSGTPYSVYCSTPFLPVRDDNGVIVGNSGCDYNADGNNFDYLNTPSFGNFKSGSRSDYIRGIFNASDFPVPSLGGEGNLGRDTFIGPGYADTDFSIIKNTRIPWFIGTEGANLQFRTEVFNLFNRVNLTQVTGDTGSPFFGRSTSTYSARNIQFGLRIAF